MNKISSYVIENDTDMFAVVVDSEFQLFQTEAEAEAILEAIFRYAGGSQSIDDTLFTFYELLSPQSSSDGRANGQKLSECEPCDLMAFITATRERIQAMPDPDCKFEEFFR